MEYVEHEENEIHSTITVDKDLVQELIYQIADFDYGVPMEVPIACYLSADHPFARLAALFDCDK